MTELEGWTHYFFDDGSLDDEPNPDVVKVDDPEQIIHSVLICPCCEASHMTRHQTLMFVELTVNDSGYVWVSYWKCVNCGCEEPDI